MSDLGNSIVRELTLLKTLFSLAAVFSVLTDCYAASACNKPSDEILTSIVRVLNNDGSQASGVVISRDFVLTAAHVVEGAGPFFVKFDRRIEQAVLHSVDLANDLAVLSVLTHGLTPIPLSIGGLHPNEPVWALGYPLGGDLEMSRGYVEDFYQGAVQTSAEIDSGHSGGGLLSCEADRHVLAGMLRGYGAYQRDGNLVKVDNFSISVPSHTIKSFVWN